MNGEDRLIVLMRKAGYGVICKGLCRDELIFTNLLFTTTEAAVRTIGQRYSQPGRIRVHFNLPE